MNIAALQTHPWQLHTLVALWYVHMVRACWQGAVLVAAVWGICRVWKNLPAAVRCTLWWLTCVKILSGLLWPAPIDVAVLPSRTPSLHMVVGAALVGRRIPGERTSRSIFQSASSVMADAAVSQPMALAARAASTPGRHVPLAAAALWAWTVGFVLSIVATGRQIAVILHMTRRSYRVEDGDLLEAARQIALSMGMTKSPPLFVSDTAPGPFTAGWTRPVILLPRSDLASLSRSELRSVLGHEMAHIRRHDLWMGLAPVLARTVFFFHPFVWLACREYELAQEAACDTEALRVTGARPDAYGQLLLRLSAPANATPCRVAALGVSADYRLLMRRLKGLETSQRCRVPAWLMALAALAVMTCSSLRLTARAAGGANPIPVTAHISTARRSHGIRRASAHRTQPPSQEWQASRDAAIALQDAAMARRAAAMTTEHKELTVLRSELEAQRQFMIADRNALEAQKRALTRAVANKARAQNAALAAQIQMLRARQDALAAEQKALSLRMAPDRTPPPSSPDVRPKHSSPSRSLATPNSASADTIAQTSLRSPGADAINSAAPASSSADVAPPAR